MKRAIALIIVAAGSLTAADAGKLNDAERAYLIEQLELSKKNFLASINGLSPAQWTFKPAPNVWSAAECAEHIVLAEDFIYNGAQAILKTPAVERPANSNAQYDKGIVARLQDRSQKAIAPEPIVPAGKIPTPADAVRVFSEKRDRHIAYIRQTQDDLRAHVGDGPAGPWDAYQFLLMMSAHSARHTLQIREVEANPSFPRSR
jgi:hypothetical protein